MSSRLIQKNATNWELFAIVTKGESILNQGCLNT